MHYLQIKNGMNLGDVATFANKKALDGDKTLFDRIIKEAKGNYSVRKAYGAFAELPNIKTKSPQLALHAITESINGIDADEYSDFIEGIELDGLEETDINMAIHEAIVRPAGSPAYMDAMEYLMEAMTESDCPECDEEYETLTDEDKDFLSELAEADEDKKELMFDNLKDKALAIAEKDISDALDADTAKEIAESLVRLGKMKPSDDNIIRLYEFCNK